MNLDEIESAFKRLGLTHLDYFDPGAGVFVPGGSRGESKNSRCQVDRDIASAPRELLRTLEAAETLLPETDKGSSGGALSPGGPMSLADVEVDCSAWGHVYRHRGRAESERDDCHRPNLLRCVWCSSELVVRCGATRASRCEPCSTSHRKDVAYIGRSGVSDSPTGFFFVTLTAPGKDLLPWDPDVCSHDRAVACSGDLGCRVNLFDAAAWNYRMTQNWSWFVTYLRRELKRYGLTLEFFKAIETQERGVLHIHAMVRVEGGVISRRRLREMVATCAREWDFGRQVDVQHVQPGDGREMARKAGYCASYISKSADSPAPCFIFEEGIDLSTGEGVAVHSWKGYRPWSASHGFGDTMKAIKHRRRNWACQEGDGVTPPPGGAAVPSGAAGALDLKRDRYTRLATGEIVLPFVGGLSAV